MNKSKKNSKKKNPKKTDGVIYYTGRVPNRFHIPPNNIWKDSTFQVMAHELLHLNAPRQNLEYYIRQTGARYVVPRRSPILVKRRSPVRRYPFSPIKTVRYIYI